MYFPILRGRQFELLALRECASKRLIGDKVIPIIEPVKLSSTYMTTIEEFIKTGMRIAVIRNPLVGAWNKEEQKERGKQIYVKVNEQFQAENVISSYYVTPGLKQSIDETLGRDKSLNSLILLCTNPEYIECYEEVVGSNGPLYSVIPDKGDFRRRIRVNRVMLEDHFNKRIRNVDYLQTPNEFFSEDHLYYKDDGYMGFSDYSVIGEEYSETGFAPYAVAIHIVYMDSQKRLRVAHFVSDSNDDISDPAKKFSEAVKKLVEWNKKEKLNTEGIRNLEMAFARKIYPGLGVVKKYCVMHHLELMSRYLEEVSK